MKTTLLRASAAALAVLGMAVAPAAATPLYEAPAPAPAVSVTGPGLIQGPGQGEIVTPMLSPCQVFSWFIFCRR